MGLLEKAQRTQGLIQNEQSDIGENDREWREKNDGRLV
jgi:hypothetical protein